MKSRHIKKVSKKKADRGRLKIHSQIHRNFLLPGQSKILFVDSLRLPIQYFTDWGAFCHTKLPIEP